MALSISTSYLPAARYDGEKYRLLEHHRLYGICPASRYQAMPAQFRPPMPQFCTLEDRKYKPVVDKPRRLSFIRFLLGRLSAC